MIMCACPFVQAQTTAPSTAPSTAQAQFDAASKQADARFQADQQLCNRDPDSASRMQCKRDANAEYDKAIAAAKAHMAASAKPAPIQAPQPVQSVCADCGKVVSVGQVEKKGEGSAMGMVAGGVAGALLGNQIGGGTGKTLATGGGAAGGAFAGREIEKRMTSQKVWDVKVQYANGNSSNFEFQNDPGFRVGDSVKNSDRSIVRQ